MDRESDRDSNNNIGSELLINPKKKASNAPSGASSVLSGGGGGEVGAAAEGGDASSVPTMRVRASTASAMDARTATVGNIMGSRRTRSELLDIDREHEGAGRAPSFMLNKKQRREEDDDDMRTGAGDELDDEEEIRRQHVLRRTMDRRRRQYDMTPSERSWRRSVRGDEEESVMSPSEKSLSAGRSHHYHHRRRTASAARPMTEEEIRVAKQGILHEFDRLEKKNYKLSHKFSLDSSLEEMKAEYERIKKDKSLDHSIQFQKNILMMCVNSIEYLNNRFDPFDFDLEGWSMSVGDSLEDYEEIFERLHEKYGGTSKMEPEMQLLFSLGGSAMMFHIENKLFKRRMGGNNGGNNGGGGDRPPQRSGGGGGSVLNILGSLFGGITGGGSGGGAGGGGAKRSAAQQSQQQPQQQSRQQQQQDDDVAMRGPVEDDILREIQQNASRGYQNERIDMISHGGDSDMEDVKDGTGVSVFNDNETENPASSAEAAPAPSSSSMRGGGGRGSRGGGRGGGRKGKTLAL